MSTPGPVPTVFVATTVHVYVLPVVSPVTVNGESGPVCVPVTPPLLDTHVVVNPVIGLPPLVSGAANETESGPVVAVVEPDTAVTFLGAAGTVGMMTVFDGADATPVPTAFVAATVQV